MFSSVHGQVRVLSLADDSVRAASPLACTDSRFDVERVASVEEGVTTVRDRPPDCVVSDHDPPEIDGLAFLRAVRETHPGLPFVIYTDNGSETVASEAISAGVTEYLQRGADSASHERLADRVEDVVAACEPDGVPTALPAEPQHPVATAPETVLRVDSNGEIVSANQRDRDGLTIETGDIVGRQYDSLPWEGVGDEQTADLELPFRRVLESGDTVEGFLCDVVLPRGASRTVEISGAPVTDDAGAVEGGVFSVAVVTLCAERLRALERRDEFLRHSPDLVTVLTETGVVEYQSPTPPEVHDFEPRDMTGEKPETYVHPDDIERVLSDFEQLTDGDPGQTVQTEFRVRVASGEYLWFENRAVNHLGREPIDGILVVSREITERKETERSLADSVSTVTQLQEATGRLLEATDIDEATEIAIESTGEAFEFDAAGIWRSTADQTRLEPVATTENGETLLGEPPTYSAETQSLSWGAFEDQQTRVIDDMADYEDRYNSETPIQSELIVPLGEYGLVNIGSTERAAFDDQDIRRVEVWGNVVESALARLTQIERLEQRERELQRQRDRLDEFAGFVSHDLRNPLQVARGRLQLVADEHPSEPLCDVERALDRMDHLIEDVLDLARQGSAVGETEPVHLRELFSRCWDTVDTGESELNVQTACTIRADDSRLASALENLFWNAVEHGDEVVTVTAGALEDDSGFYVADDGRGIPDRERGDIFDSGYSTADDGTGLGLAIVERVVEAHGWTIDVSESAAGGARFEVTGVEFVD